MKYKQLSLAITAMLAAVAEANKIDQTVVSKGYNIEPVAVQNMYDEITKSIDFLSKINVIGKDEKVGQRQSRARFVHTQPVFPNVVGKFHAIVAKIQLQRYAAP